MDSALTKIGWSLFDWAKVIIQGAIFSALSQLSDSLTVIHAIAAV
jgi:hypothetical protein